MKDDSNGKLYLVWGNKGGADGGQDNVTDISLEATLATVPEPSTASLGLLGLAMLMLRRRNKKAL